MNNINLHNSFSYYTNKNVPEELENSDIDILRSREILSLHCNDYFKLHISECDFNLLNIDDDKYNFLYSNNISLILRRYVYNVLCKREDDILYCNFDDKLYCKLDSKAILEGLEYTRNDAMFMDFCYQVLKARMVYLGFNPSLGKADSFRKSLNNYLYLKSNITKSTIIKTMAFMLGLSYDNVIYILENLEFSTTPANNIEDAALKIIRELDVANEANYVKAYEDVANLEKKWTNFENNREFFELVQKHFPKKNAFFDTSINETMLELGLDIENIAHISTTQDQYEYFLKDLRLDFLQDECAKNIYYRKNTSLKKRHILYLYFYICLLHYDEYFIEANIQELNKYFIRPANKTLVKFGFAKVNYKNYFDKFLMMCLLSYDPIALFNETMVNEGV